MTEPERNPFDRLNEWLSSWKASFEQLQRRFGRTVAILLTVSVASTLVLYYFWSNWEDIKKRPGAEWVVKHLPFTQRSIRTVPTGLLTIAVAHLEHDEDREQENVLLDELGHFKGVEIGAVDRMVEWPASETEGAAEKMAEEEAQSLLRQTGADVLIWGRVLVLSLNNQKAQRAMRLYWTPAQELRGAKYTERYQIETIALPSQFWDDLKQTLGLLTQSRISLLTLNQSGRYVADKLTPLIDQVRLLVQSREGVWNPDTLAGVQFSLAVALALDGEQSGKYDLLDESIDYFHKVMEQWTRERVPLKWAATKTSLGIALVTLGDGKIGTERLEQAVAAYQDALQEFTSERVPLDWAATKNNLGDALRALGEREVGPERLEEAVAAYQDALQGFTRERAPLDWAMTKNNLGNALRALGERENGTARLDEAIKAFHEALTQFNRERTPHYWAMTENSLGDALRALGVRESVTTRLDEAVNAFNEALKIRARKLVPLDWAATKNNLGIALAALGTRGKSDRTFTCTFKASNPDTRHCVVKPSDSSEHLERAIGAFNEALQERTRERVPLHWAMTQNNLGAALLALWDQESSPMISRDRESGTERLVEAVAAFREALTELTTEAAPYQHLIAQENFDRANALLVQRRNK